MGCHAGLNVSDSFPTTPDTASRLRDWAQALAQNGAGVYVANTGYGYGDFDTIALSERLMTMFAHNLASDGSIGRKLVLAKQQYFASIASYDPYAEKALAEATFYGLPFYRIGTGPDPRRRRCLTRRRPRRRTSPPRRCRSRSPARTRWSPTRRRAASTGRRPTVGSST